MLNIIKLKNAVNNTISIIGTLETQSITDLEIDLRAMIKVLDSESTNLIDEIENSVSIQSRMIDHNCLYEIENSILRVDSSVPDDTLNSVKTVLNSMGDKINELENEIRSKNIEKLNEISADEKLRTEFINTLKSNNTKALILFDGNDVRQSLLDTFVTQDSKIMNQEKDKIISSAITYLDLATKKYDEYINKIQDLVQVIEDTETLVKCCAIAKEVIHSYGRDSLIAKTPNELYPIIETKLRGVI